MEIAAAIKNALKDMILPELDKIKADGAETRILLGSLNDRLESTNKRIDDLSTRIDGIQNQLSDQSRRIDGTNQRIDAAVEKLENKMENKLEAINQRLDVTNQRLDRLYDIIVRRDEHYSLEQKVLELEREMQKIKVKIAV